MHFFIRSFIALFLLFSFQFVFAEDYYWTSGYHVGTKFPSADAACQAIKSDFTNADSVTAVLTSPDFAKCRLVTNGNVYDGIQVNRFGSGCTPPAVLNPSTGSCEAPEPDLCESTAGQTIKHEYSYTQHDADGNPTPDPPPVCHDNGCQYTNDFGTFHRNRDPANNDAFIGFFTYKGNGLACTSGNPPAGSEFDQPPSKPAEPSEPKYNQENNCSDWVTQPDGTVTRSCSSSTEYDQPGPVNCNGSNCTPGTPPTEYNKTEVSETTEKTTNPDGSTKTETTTTKETVKCKGSKPCTGTSSETTNISGTNPDGSPGDESTECKGTGCKEDGNPGMGDEDDEEDEPSSSVSGGETCEVPPSCEGDAVQCAILKQQFEARCDFEEAGDFEGSKTDIEGLFDGEQFELETADIQTPSFINSGARFLPASCPPPQQISLTSNGGHTYSLKFDPLCSFASDFSYLIMAMMSIWCAVYVGRAFGGE